MPVYSLTAEGYVYFTDGCTNIRMYLCGSRITHTRQAHTTIKAYYGSDVNLAVTVWEWYTAVCELVPPTDCTLSLPLDILIGTKAWEGAAPYCVSVGSKSIRACNPLYCSKLGIYWEAVDDDGNEYTTEVPVTPESLAAALKPAPPLLKPQSLYGYAFKVGTLCPMGTVPPYWKSLIPKLTTSPVDVASMSDDLNEHYRAGTLCKPDTQLSDLIINSALVWGPLPNADPSEEPVTLLEGYGLKVKVKGNKPSEPLTRWYKDGPTFNIINYCTEPSLPLLYLLQDSGYISKLVSVDDGDGKVTLTDEGLYFNARPDARTPSALLMAYS